MSATPEIVSVLTKLLQRKAEKLREQSNQLQCSLNSGRAKVNKDLDELKSKFGNIEDKNLELSKSAGDTNLKIQLPENKTTYNEIIWNIGDEAFFQHGTG